LGVLIDTNVLLDIVTDDAEWYGWSVTNMNRLALAGGLAINDVIFAELAPSFEKFEEVSALIEDLRLQMRPIPREARFLAGKVHQSYRRSTGPKVGVLPDFFIGAQAAVEGLALLTRDTRRFRTYFPTVELITP
jgi:predicted nucleic acid-binding protein